MVAPLSRDRLTRHWWAVQVVYPAVHEPSLFAMHIIHLIPLLAKPAAESLQNSVGKFVRPLAIVRMRRCRTFQADRRCSRIAMHTKHCRSTATYVGHR